MNLFYSKLTPLVDITANTDDCVILRVKPHSQSELIKIVGLYGTERQFRIEKAFGKTCRIGINSMSRSATSTTVTVWRDSGVEDISLPIISTNRLEREILGCVCVDYGIPIFFESSRTGYTGSDIMSVWDKYRDPDQLLRFTVDDNRHHMTVWLNEYPVVSQMQSYDQLVILQESLPAINIKSGSKFREWFDVHAGYAFSTDYEHFTSRSVRLSKLVDSSELEDYISACTNYAQKTVVNVGGLFQINVEKSASARRYAVYVSRVLNDAGGTLHCYPGTSLTFDEIGVVDVNSIVEPVTVTPKQEKLKCQ